MGATFQPEFVFPVNARDESGRSPNQGSTGRARRPAPFAFGRALVRRRRPSVAARRIDGGTGIATIGGPYLPFC